MKTISEIYGSNSGGSTWKGDDLHNEEWELIICGTEEKNMEQTNFDTGEKFRADKVILSFAGDDKKLILNKTNALRIEAAYGGDHSSWIGKPIILYPEDWQGKPVVRVRVPKAVRKVAPSRYSENPADGMDNA